MVGDFKNAKLTPESIAMARKIRKAVEYETRIAAYASELLIAVQNANRLLFKTYRYAPPKHKAELARSIHELHGLIIKVKGKNK